MYFLCLSEWLSYHGRNVLGIKQLSWENLSSVLWDRPARDFKSLNRIETIDVLSRQWITFLFGFYDLSRLFHPFWAETIVRWGQKREIPKKTHLTTRKQNLACLTCDPSSDPQQWATGAAMNNTTVLIILHGCPDWSAPLLLVRTGFANAVAQVFLK